MTDSAGDLLTPEQVADRLGKSADYWARQARRKGAPHVRLGRSIRFTEADVAEIVRRAHVDVADPLRTQTPASQRHA